MIDLKLNKRILLVEGLEHQKSMCIDIDKEEGGSFLVLIGGPYNYRVDPLPEGSWDEPIKASEVTEEIAKSIVSKGDLYPNYHQRYFIHDTALECFQDLLTHHSLSPDKTILIIEK